MLLLVANPIFQSGEWKGKLAPVDVMPLRHKTEQYLMEAFDEDSRFLGSVGSITFTYHGSRDEYELRAAAIVNQIGKQPKTVACSTSIVLGRFCLGDDFAVSILEGIVEALGFEKALQAA